LALKIDSHQHFWQYDPTQHVWMTDEMDVLKRDYLPKDLAPLMAETGIDGTIAVQARQNLEETEWLLALADANDFIKGVVGWVDLCSPDIRDQLEKYAAHPKLVGVRHVVHDEPDDHFMLNANFLRGIAALAKFDLTYDLLIRPQHIPVSTEVVKQFPDQPFVVDHIAKPLIKDGIRQPWEQDIRELAKLDNVFCKVSGMVTEARWKGWQQSDFVPYLDVILDAFGVERIMFGSDWPVSTLSGTYADVLNIIRVYLEQLDESDHVKVLGQNAERFYSIL